MRLKGKRAVFRQILARALWKFKFVILSLQITNLKFKYAICEAKMKKFEARTMHFEAKMKHFDPKPLKNAGFGPLAGHFRATVPLGIKYTFDI